MEHNFAAKKLRVSWALTLAVALITAGCFFLTQAEAPVVRAQGVTFTIGTPLPNLTSLETTLFNTGFQPFNKIWDAQQGLGPVFTQDQCSVCHNSPNNVAGGNSKQKVTFVGKINLDGTYNDLSTNPNEGGAQIQPMSVQKFKPSCILKGEVVPVDATIRAKHQAPQLFGLGLIDNIADADILAQAVDKGMGVFGVANMVLDENGNLRPGRFGLKSQFADLIQMTASAELHEIGVTNPVPDFGNEDLPQGNPIPPNCSINTEPNDPDGLQMIDMYHYLLYLAPLPPGSGNTNGQALFSSIGCALCHLPSYTTVSNVTVLQTYVPPVTFNSPGLQSQTVNLYSDLLLHDMGGTLGDGVQVGQATATQYRTRPLWGLNSRILSGNGLLHDGRTTDVTKAILLHGGEAKQVIKNFKALSSTDQGDLIAFISSL
jgi:CxxC motif-containing protein (DUF1111 family)